MSDYTSVRYRSLESRSVVITGGASGIGEEMVKAFVAQGARVSFIDIATEAGLALAGDTGAAFHACDVTDIPALRAVLATIETDRGGVDVLVNNAGVTVRKLALEVTQAEWDEVVGVNLKGTFFMSQQMGRHLVAAKRPGCVVSIASTHGTIGFAQRTTYGISKAGIIHMTRMLAYEWAEHGIRVNAVAPGTVETRTRAEYFKANPVARQAMVDRVPLHRFGTPAEVAGAVRYLASPEAAYVTGHVLAINGGMYT